MKRRIVVLLSAASMVLLLAVIGVEITRRAAIGVEIKQLADEKVELELAIHRLEQDYTSAKQDYEEYRHRIALRRGG